MCVFAFPSATIYRYHIVYRDGPLYPVNQLRNVALEQARSPFVFLTDIDFLPVVGLYETLRNYIRLLRMDTPRDQQMESIQQQPPNRALVVPAFETHR